MPPKKKTSKLNEILDKTNDEVNNSEEIIDMEMLQRNLEALFDQRFKEQTSRIDDLFTKLSKSTKSDFDEIRKSQEFLGSKFDELATSMKEIKLENAMLKEKNEYLQQRLSCLEKKVDVAEIDIENQRRYSRRDTLEIHGIPVISGENTNDIILKVAQLAVPEGNFDGSIVSMSHRLPTTRGNIPPIIAKFVRRDIRDVIYSKRRNLSLKSTQNLGLSASNRIYINESLTPQSRAILMEAKRFRNQNGFKFIWTRNGRVFLRKEEGQRVHIFDSMKELEDFKGSYQYD